MTSQPGDYKNPPLDRRRPESDFLVPETNSDPYAEELQPAGGTVCDVCHLVVEAGRWTWPTDDHRIPAAAPDPDTPTQTCPACRRVRDGYPAGFVNLSGAFVGGHLHEILEVIEEISSLELEEHPLNRIIELSSGRSGVEFTTTDLHLPRRVGEALRDAFEGELSLDYLEDGHQVRVDWVRSDLPPAEEEPAEPSGPPAEPLVELSSRDVAITPEVRNYLDERIARLPEFYDRIVASRVVLRGETRHHREGGPYSVHIFLEVPQRLISVTRQKRENLHVAIREAFSAAERQLQEYAEKLRGEVSALDTPPRGDVLRIFPELGYGFIDTPRGDAYFHKNAVLAGRFDEIEPGVTVRYELEHGIEGLQASTVALPGD